MHGPALSEEPGAVGRYRLTGWNVGLAAPVDRTGSWWKRAQSGTESVIQRDLGAGVQRTFLASVDRGVTVEGPVASSHVEAVRRSQFTGLTAVTIEPAARSVGAAFHTLDAHRAELWVDAAWARSKVIADALEAIRSPHFLRRLSAVGGYDLTGCGERI